MKTCTIAAIATAMLFAFGCTTIDRQSTSAANPLHAGDPSLLDPDMGIYGIPYGTSEEAFVSLHGQPMGRATLSRTGSTLIYNNTHAFLFEQGKLAGLRISLGMFDRKLTYGRYDEGKFDRISWRLPEGIENGMALAEVRNILGDRLAMRGELQHYYLTAKSRVNLDFALVRDSDGSSSYKVCGMYVEYGAREPADKITSAVGFAGIGATIDRPFASAALTIMSVSPYGSADEAQLKSGTPIYSIDGRPTSGLSVAGAAGLLRGEPGTSVDLLVHDAVTGKPKRIRLKRQPIKY